MGTAAATRQQVGDARRRPTSAPRSGKHLRDPFYDRGTNDKGIGIQLAYSLARVLLGFGWRRWSPCRSAS